MKKWILVMVIASFAVSARFVVAEEGHSHEHGESHGAMPSMAGQGEGSAQKVTGEVVDLACYLSEGLSGPNHRECAQKCIASGLPVGIKSGDQIYLAMGSEHEPANKTLASLAAKNVTAEGTVTERGGVHLLAIKKLTVNESIDLVF